MWQGVSVIAKPTAELLTLEQIKARVRIDAPDDDNLLPALVLGAIARIDGPSGVGYAMLPQTWRKSMDCFPCRIILPGAPIKGIKSISYIDADGFSQTLPATDYHADLDSEPVRVEPAYSKSWPSTRGVIGAVKVDYELGTEVADVPPDLVDVVCLIVAHRFKNRDAVIEGTVSDLPFGVEYILQEYRRAHVAA
ncbi:hypothetical protein C5748_17045 [Phyllobacterium phragmitis]|uniref:Phage gp6-like head-tail connector protein n=1 Tax=Phyllobacterium phragmitis TaxID=2670329 RepID=A0A2S9INV3_9HYPH|nr:phage head-tail connector protein [Phyllobacterium phragmitis]PRD42172.1 hypothetical protein C5748_17045 [Phyllobacterium phragmitis]